MHAATCSQCQQKHSTDALAFSTGTWDEGSLTAVWRGEPSRCGAAHHEQDTAGRQDAARNPERLRFPAHPRAAQPGRRGEWPGGRRIAATVQCCELPLFSQKPGAGLLTERLLASLG